MVRGPGSNSISKKSTFFRRVFENFGNQVICMRNRFLGLELRSDQYFEEQLKDKEPFKASKFIKTSKGIVFDFYWYSQFSRYSYHVKLEPV